jgi:hypothetical protein
MDKDLVAVKYRRQTKDFRIMKNQYLQPLAIRIRIDLVTLLVNYKDRVHGLCSQLYIIKMIYSIRILI